MKNNNMFEEMKLLGITDIAIYDQVQKARALYYHGYAKGTPYEAIAILAKTITDGYITPTIEITVTDTVVEDLPL